MTTNCSKCDCAKAQCGCDDRGLTTNPPCATGTPACPNPEPCAETWSDCCVIHNGDSFTYLNPGEIAIPLNEKVNAVNDVKQPLPEKAGFAIFQGERLCDTWQRFIAYYECGFTGVETPYGLKSKSITSTTLTIGWTPTELGEAYQVFIAPASTATFTYVDTVNQSTNPQITITGLTPNTTYFVCVKAIADRVLSCASVSLILTTKLV